MTKNYFAFFLFCLALNSYSQEVFTFSGYNGAVINLTASTATVNDDITIVFEDADVIENFYTQSQNEIYMYGGFTTDAGPFQFTPDFYTLSEQIQLPLVASDGDPDTSPNTYSVTINLAQLFPSVPTGTMIYGFNLLFQNQFNDGGNNQTADLYIDLVDAVTLGIQEFSGMQSVRMVKDEIITQNYQGKLMISVYDISGRLINSSVETITSSSYRMSLDLPKKQMNFIVVKSEDSSFAKTFKHISN